MSPAALPTPSPSTDNNTSGKVRPPAKLAHVVIRTNQIDKMKHFYADFLGGRIVLDTGSLAFVAYDEEHHRIGLIAAPGTKNKDYDTCGLEHIAFTFETLKDLCEAYKQRKALGMKKPVWCVNHGPTTSMYYRDPDGNLIETQVDNFDTAEEGNAFVAGPEFQENFVGTDFEPEELCRLVESGMDERELKVRREIGPRGTEALREVERRFRGEEE